MGWTDRITAARGALVAFVALTATGAGCFGAGTELTSELVVDGLVRPVFVTAPPGDVGRIFIVEQREGNVGRIRVLHLDTQTLNATPFLSVSPVATSSEQGLLGLAFDPDYANNGHFYVNYTAGGGGETFVVRYTVSGDPDVADPGSAMTVLRQPQPEANHNGGWLGFGSDGYLYISLGDGGGGNDQHGTIGNAQDITSNLLGKLLRIDVAGDDFPADANRNYAIPPDNPFVGVTGDDEIWAYGLRNPWRCCFDRATGDLYIGDVGQSAREEVNVQLADSTGGANYGWRCMEGFNCTGLSGCTCNDAALTLPVHDYTHTQGCSITGGCVYRGGRIWDLRGTYFFADYCQGTIWSFEYGTGGVADFRNRTTELAPGGGRSIDNVSSFGEDAAGELYICDLADGEVYRIVPEGLVVGDLNADGVIDNGDISAFVLALTDRGTYESMYPGVDVDVTADIDLDGTFNSADVPAFVVLLTEL